MMDLREKLRKNPVDKMKISELREEEMRIKNQVERIRKDINKLEKDKKKKFEEGVGADTIKKKMLAQELKQLDMEAKMNMKNFTAAHKQYMLVSNLLTVKKYEDQLKKSAIWDKLTNVSPEQLESALIKVNLSGREFDDVLNNLNRVFEMDVAESEGIEDESDKQLFDAWSSVESGEIDVEDAHKTFSVDRNLEEEEEE
ncbi:MAG: hypothetical protein R6U44_00640 [Archaeoglobaceae archaeon]